QRSPVCACSLVSSLLLSGATMSQQSSLTQSAHSVRQVLTAYRLDTPTTASATNAGNGNHPEPPRFPDMTIRIGTSERDGTFYSQGRALKTLFGRRPALAAVEVMESKSASTENANRLHAGEIEFGFMASNWLGRAKNGETPFERPIDLAMAAPMNAGPLFFIVRTQSPI